MPERVIGLLLITALVVVANLWILRVWWRAIIRNDRWVLLFPLAFPLVIFGPMFVVDFAGEWLLPPFDHQEKFVFTILWALPTLVASLLNARKYHHSRSISAQTHVPTKG